MTPPNHDDLIARALCIAAGADETPLDEADAMLDLLIDRFPSQAQAYLHEFRSSRPAPHLRVVRLRHRVRQP